MHSFIAVTVFNLVLHVLLLQMPKADWSVEPVAQRTFSYGGHFASVS